MEDAEKSNEKSKEKIFTHIKENPRITTVELSESIGLSIGGIEKNLRSLKADGIIRRIGPDKGGYWEIIKALTPYK